MIPHHALQHFEALDTDDKLTAINKLYHLNRDRITRRIQTERQLTELNRRLDEFERQYNEIKKLRKNKTTKGELELQLAIEELFSE